MVNFKENYHFQGSGGGPSFSRDGGSNFFHGGSNCLFHIQTHITCDFPGGSGPTAPLDPHLNLTDLSPSGPVRRFAEPDLGLN